MGTNGPKQGYYAIYKTEDGGNTWTNTNQEKHFGCRVVDIAIDPRNTKNIWAVTSPMEDRNSCPGRLYRSGDRGKTWENIIKQQLGFTTVVVDPKDSNRVFTGSYSHIDSGIKEHYFDGNKWLCRSPSLPTDGGDSVVLDIAFAPQDSHVLYAAWKNIKPGDTFHDVSGKVSRSKGGGEDWETYSVDYEFNSLAVHPADSDVIFGGERCLGIYKSKDYGQSWDAANKGISSVIVYDVAIDPKDSAHILAGTLAGIYEKQPDKPWEPLLHHGTYSLEFHPTDSLTFYAGLHGYLAKTKDGGHTWTYSEHLNSSRVNDITIDPENDTVYIAASRGSDYLGKIHKSEDGGASFSEVLIAENQSGDSYDFNTVVAKGEFFTGGWGDGLVVDFSTLTDGVFFAKGHQWDQGPVWWDEDMDKVQNSLSVFLGRTYYVQKLIIQVDNNDDYIISWQDMDQGYMEVQVIPNRHWGMDDPIVIEVEAITDAFKIEHDVNGAGDGLYSVSEFKAMVVTLDPVEHLNSSRINDFTIDPDKDTVYIAASQGSDYFGKLYNSEESGGFLFRGVGCERSV